MTEQFQSAIEQFTETMNEAIGQFKKVPITKSMKDDDVRDILEQELIDFLKNENKNYEKNQNNDMFDRYFDKFLCDEDLETNSKYEFVFNNENNDNDDETIALYTFDVNDMLTRLITDNDSDSELETINYENFLKYLNGDDDDENYNANEEKDLPEYW